MAGWQMCWVCLSCASGVYIGRKLGEDLIGLGWELSCGCWSLRNASPMSQGCGGAGQAPATALGFLLLLLQLISLSSRALACFQYLLVDFCLLTRPQPSAASDLCCGLQGRWLLACACKALCGCLMLCDSVSAFRALGSFALDTTQHCDIQQSSGSSLVTPAHEREVALVLWRAANTAVASFYLAYFTFTCDLRVSRASLETSFQR